jgi:hypothetical protein
VTTALAELVVRHTRRHMPTRRVAVDDAYLPAGGAAHGPLLLGAVVAEFIGDLHVEDRAPFARLAREAREGLLVPRIAMRYRLQTDTHGLDRSRHRIVIEHGRLVLELDTHGRAEPQILASVMAAAALGTQGRELGVRAIEASMRRPGELPEGLGVRRLADGRHGPIPIVGRPGRAAPGSDRPRSWAGVAAEHRWAMEVLGMRAGAEVHRDDVVARFRRLVRNVHPDHGGAAVGAAERIAELREARERLLAGATGLAERR